ncbi:signal peptidase I [Croceifilum oryzae]|uniref:Signal peptidase I n=1 Tax=Croceifilum oryzae TaxID=1553429 RepID=A0AAJ1TJZ0_9BACL|nr:signal peptidase I [Croceifilum oryzae]MDQ0418297.1 signal peptidase I [Croceifilum oryzae]
MAGENRTLREWIMAAFVATAILLICRYIFFAPYQVKGESMYPTLKGNELLIVNKFIYKIKEPKYGEIVVFHSKEEKDFIKRVIGLPGDHIKITNGKLFRNEKEVGELYIANKIDPSTSFEEVVVPKGEIYVLGDNRPHSEDSRAIGPVDEKEVVGRAELVLMPFSQTQLLEP